MRAGVSSSGRWWVSMGPLGWLLAIWLVGPLWLAWHLLLGVAWLCVLACRAIAEHRAAARRTA
jgi:hypothetical protein